MSEPLSLSPADEHNHRLVENVHPRGWINPVPAGRYHLVVIGAGTAGLVTAAGAAGLGARVALVERSLMGGDCLNFGCVPSKALLASARAVAAVRRAGEFGVRVPDGVSVDFATVMERMRRLRASISPHDSAARFRDLGVDVYLGQGRFIDSGTIDVDGTRLSFTKAVIATGTRPLAPRIPGLSNVPSLTNESLFTLTELPRRLGVVGGGPVGCEMAQAFARFGSEVILVETEHGILPREDRDAAALVQQALERDGVRLLCCGRNLEILARDGIRLCVESHGTVHEQPVDRLLVAAGRAANVEGLNLDVVGVDHDGQGIKVDDRLRTTNPRIFAAGDVCSPFRFTHAADFMARTVLQNTLFPGRKKASSLVIPWCTYTSPELAHVGITPAAAERSGIRIDTFVQSFHQVDRALLEGEDHGLAKVHLKRGTDRILGATIVSEHAGDLICEMTLAMTHGLGLGTIGSTIHPYPTQAEALRKLADQYNRTRLTPFIKSILGHWMAWRRGR